LRRARRRLIGQTRCQRWVPRHPHDSSCTPRQPPSRIRPRANTYKHTRVNLLEGPHSAASETSQLCHIAAGTRRSSGQLPEQYFHPTLRRSTRDARLTPQDVFPKLGEMGLLGVTVPEKWGGLGLGYLEHTIAMEGEWFGNGAGVIGSRSARWCSGRSAKWAKCIPWCLTR
jgi:hypothetical protein